MLSVNGKPEIRFKSQFVYKNLRLMPEKTTVPNRISIAFMVKSRTAVIWAMESDILLRWKPDRIFTLSAWPNLQKRAAGSAAGFTQHCRLLKKNRQITRAINSPKFILA
jgi:hypothetical protein